MKGLNAIDSRIRCLISLSLDVPVYVYLSTNDIFRPWMLNCHFIQSFVAVVVVAFLHKLSHGLLYSKRIYSTVQAKFCVYFLRSKT